MLANGIFFYEQISCGKFSAQVRSAEFSDSFLMVEEDCNQPLMSGGRLGDSHISLTIHSPTNSHGIFCGKPMGSAHVGLLAPDRDFELYTKTPLNMFTLTLGISDPKFQEVSQLLIDYFHRNYRNGDVIEKDQPQDFMGIDLCPSAPRRGHLRQFAAFS